MDKRSLLGLAFCTVAALATQGCSFAPAEESDGSRDAFNAFGRAKDCGFEAVGLDSNNVFVQYVRMDVDGHAMDFHLTGLKDPKRYDQATIYADVVTRGGIDAMREGSRQDLVRDRLLICFMDERLISYDEWHYKTGIPIADLPLSVVSAELTKKSATAMEKCKARIVATEDQILGHASYATFAATITTDPPLPDCKTGGDALNSNRCSSPRCP